MNFDVIAIDEGQFYPDIAEFCDKLATDHTKQVLVSGLDGTFERKPFGNIHKLIPMSEKVHKLVAICQLCGEDASFSHRVKSENKEVELIGQQYYMPLCRHCYQA